MFSQSDDELVGEVPVEVHERLLALVEEPGFTESGLSVALEVAASIAKGR